MLRELQIANLAIIDRLQVEFDAGLNILTGETGAGKSIIIDAVNLILGGRASSDLIRAGADEASVAGLFDLTGHPALLAQLGEAGVECDGELLVKRVVSRSGKNRVFIGGGLATTGLLADVCRPLINIYGQHESQSLLKSEQHLRLLDGFAGCTELRERFAGRFEAFQKAKSELEALEQGERDAAHRLDLLSFQSDEIGKANLRPDEEQELAEERLRLVHSGKLMAATSQGYEAIYGDEQPLLGILRRVIASVTEAGAIDHALSPIASALEDGYAQLEDAALALRDYAASVESDPDLLAQLDDRLDTINKLKRKYGEDVPQILAYREKVEAELGLLAGREQHRGDLEAQMALLRKELAALGGELSATRRDAAGRLKTGMERELGELAMLHAVFETSLEGGCEPRSYGFERAEFLFSPNPGEPPKPLAKIASGGELSRLMLALKQLHPESEVPTLIFDEVDTGISGATSSLIGVKLKRVAGSQQVLVITHLPQVAAFADRHLKVEKSVVDGRTATRVEQLDREGRVAEVARMLGGARITEKTMEHAKEMIEEAAQ